MCFDPATASVVSAISAAASGAASLYQATQKPAAPPTPLQLAKTPEEFRRQNRAAGSIGSTLLTGPGGVSSISVGRTLLGS
ncbi:MAG: hypothetical protein AB1761_16780 [Pseudomonadota bacterium]